MEWALFGVVGIITLVGAGAFSKRLGIAAPLLLIIIGVAFSFIPGAPVDIPGELILLGLLPPILYSAAITVPVVDFRRNFTSISALSVTLVVVTAFVVGGALYLLFPDLSFPAAIAIGAVISPTDAVAAVALGKRLGLPARLVSILEGESLVNDATALVLLRSAIVAIGSAVTFWEVAGDFFFAVAIAVAIGLVVGVVTVLVRARLRDTVLDTAISFAVPFIAFLPAEHVGASGVLAVVAAGLYTGHAGAGRFTAQTRITERINWRTIQFLLENGVFLLMGLEITGLVGQVIDDDLSVHVAVGFGLLMAVLALAVRFAFVGPLLILLRAQGRRFERQQSRWAALIERIRGMEGPERFQRRREKIERDFERRESDLDVVRAEGLGVRGGLVLGWSGMRGVVTLAAAQSLPESIPYRPQLVLIAFTVAVVSLLVQGGTLPLLIRLTGIQGTDAAEDNRSLAGLLDELSAAGIDALDRRREGNESVDQAVLDRVRSDTLLATESAWERANVDDIADAPHRQYRALRREVIEAERAALLEARSHGGYPSRVLSRAQELLDLEELRLQQLEEPGGS